MIKPSLLSALKRSSLCLMVLLFCLPVLAQTTVHTADGKTVILEENHTWHYEDAKQAPSTKTKNCEHYAAGDVLINNKSTVPIVIVIIHKAIGGNQDATHFDNTKERLIEPGKSDVVSDVYEAKFAWEVRKQVPDTDHSGKSILEAKPSITGSGFAVRCKTTVIDIQ